MEVSSLWSSFLTLYLLFVAATVSSSSSACREAQAAQPSPEDGAASDRSSAGNGGATPTTQSAIDVASGLRLPLGEAAVFAIHGAFRICKVHQSNVATGRRQQSMQSPSLSEEPSSLTEAEQGEAEGQARSLTVALATANASSVLTTAKPSPSCATDAKRLHGALRAARYGLNLLTLGQLEIAALGDLLRDVDLVIQMLLSLTEGADADETKQIFAQVEQTIFAGLQELVDEHLLPRLKGSVVGDRNILELEVLGRSTTRSRAAEHALPSKRPMTSADKTMTNSSSTETTPGHAANPDSLVPPRIGFGTWRLNGTACEEAVYAALHHAHVRHLDTAESYGNLRCLRKAIGRSGIARAELYITTKISHFSSFHTVFYEIRRQLKILGTNYFDLVLLHRYPYGDPAALESAWRGLQELVVERGMARSVGVSNFGFAELEHLERFLSAEEEIEKQKESAGFAPRERSTSYAAQERRSRPHPVLRPSVIQNKFSVYSPGQNEVALDRDFLAHVQARYGKQALVGFSQLFANEDLGHFLSPVRDPLVITLAAALSCSPAQLLHAFSLEKHVGVIPQSRNLGRIAENAVDIRGSGRFTESTDVAAKASAAFQVLDALVLLWESSLVPGEEVVQPVWAKERLSIFSATSSTMAARGVSSRTGSDRDDAEIARHLLHSQPEESEALRKELLREMSAGGSGDEHEEQVPARRSKASLTEEQESWLRKFAEKMQSDTIAPRTDEPDIVFAEWAAGEQLRSRSATGLVASASTNQAFYAVSDSGSDLTQRHRKTESDRLRRRETMLERMLGDGNSPLNQVARTNFAELPPRVKYFLERISGTGLAHNRDVMRRHLMGTYSTLKFWGQPQTLANAGALHSVYGAGGQFQYKILGEGVEGVLDSVFGDKANGGEESEFLGSSPSAASFISPDSCFASDADLAKPTTFGTEKDDRALAQYKNTNAEGDPSTNAARSAATEGHDDVGVGHSAVSAPTLDDLVPDVSLHCHEERDARNVLDSRLEPTKLSLRRFVASIVGAPAERLIYLYSVVDFKSFVEEIHAAGTRGFLDAHIRYVAGWRWRYVLSHERDGDSGTGMERSKAFNYYLLTPRDAVALLIMGMADTLDQANGRCGWCEWLRPFNELSGDWPGNSKPPLHLYPQVRMAHVLRKYGNLARYGEPSANDDEAMAVREEKHYLPSVFGFCDVGIELTEDQETEARDLLWEVLQGNEDDHDRDSDLDSASTTSRIGARGLQAHSIGGIDYIATKRAAGAPADEIENTRHDKLLRVVKLNPYIGEPWVLLAQVFLRRGDFLAAYFASSAALTRLVQMGTAYVKTFSFATWLAGARTLRAKSRTRLTHPMAFAKKTNEDANSDTQGALADDETGFHRDASGLVDLSLFDF